jgi:uncharacterized membrane protein
MSINPILTILGMAVATYLTRVGGLWLVRRKGFPSTLQSALKSLPSAILMSILAPIVVRSGPREWVGLGITVWLVHKTGSLAAGMLVGVVFVALSRNLFPG